MKGIVMAGGSGSRLYPITKGVSKQLLPVYDKPMIYYPISVLMLAGIKEILIITTPHDSSSFKRLLGSGEQFGVKFSYCIQHNPGGIGEAFLLAEEFISQDPVCLILGDNVFYGQGFTPLLQKVCSQNSGATIFGYQVNDPSQFGVVEFDEKQKAISIEEKPISPRSNLAVTGLYFYDNSVVAIAKTLRPSERGELEITSINQEYLKRGKLSVEILGRGFAWLDTGSFAGLMDASHYVQTIQNRQGLVVACLEEIALTNGWITLEDVKVLSKDLMKNSYGQYLAELTKT